MDKIIQIMAPAVPTWAVYKDENTEDGEWYNPIVALALVDDGQGGTYIAGTDTSEDGLIELVTEVNNFIGYTHKAPTK